MPKHWYIGYRVLDEDKEILFTGGEFLEVELREDAIQIVHDKFDQFGTVELRDVEHLENPYFKKGKKNA